MNYKKINNKFFFPYLFSNFFELPAYSARVVLRVSQKKTEKKIRPAKAGFKAAKSVCCWLGLMMQLNKLNFLH